MVPQLDSLAPSKPASPTTSDQSPPASRLTEPALPVYRYFLTGGVDQLQLTSTAMLGLAGVSMVSLPLALLIAGRVLSVGAMMGLAVGAVVISLSQAILIARWTDSTSGMLVGILTLVGWTAWSCFAIPEVMLASAAVIVAILVYGLAELPNRAEAIPRARAAVAFYLAATLAYLTGSIAPLVLLATVCLGTALGNANSRGVRFFGSPVGLCFLILGMAIGILNNVATGPDDVPAWTGQSGSGAPPWPAVICLVVGVTVTWTTVRSGHAASPLGRLFVSWLLGPAVLATAGWAPVQLAMAIALPAWAAVLGLTIIRLQRRSHVGRLSFWSTVTSDALPRLSNRPPRARLGRT